jgi:dTDP-4-amino-4,6-dideoxygalactose transaminase
MNIEMVDLKGQYAKIKTEVDESIFNVVNRCNFINGEDVQLFASNLSEYLDGAIVVPCANGTDALQIALMSLNLNVGDEVIVPGFTYVATAEVIGLLKLKPIIVDVEFDNFNISIEKIEKAITEKTKVIVPVHLFGQCANMDAIMEIAKKHNLYVVEDTAQAIGAKYLFQNGIQKFASTIGDIGCISFFPSKNLGCYGDGGAIVTNNESLAKKIKMIANHGQQKKYVHDCIGINSRLDTIQAAILNVKLKHLNTYNIARYNAAQLYNKLLSGLDGIELPKLENYSTHVFHQYTVIVKNGKRDDLKNYLMLNDVPSMIYYPIPLDKQEAYRNISEVRGELTNTEKLCNSVLSLPMHTELSFEQQNYISNCVKSFFSQSNL